MSRARLLTDDDVRKLLKTHAAYRALTHCRACGEPCGEDGLCRECRDDQESYYREREGR